MQNGQNQMPTANTCTLYLLFLAIYRIVYGIHYMLGWAGSGSANKFIAHTHIMCVCGLGVCDTLFASAFCIRTRALANRPETTSNANVRSSSPCHGRFMFIRINEWIFISKENGVPQHNFSSLLKWNDANDAWTDTARWSSSVIAWWICRCLLALWYIDAIHLNKQHCNTQSGVTIIYNCDMQATHHPHFD